MTTELPVPPLFSVKDKDGNVHDHVFLCTLAFIIQLVVDGEGNPVRLPNGGFQTVRTRGRFYKVTP